MLTNYLPPGADYLRFLPEIILTAFGLAIMMLEPFTPARRKSSLGVLALIGIAAAFAADCWAYFFAGPAFHNMIVIDGYTTFFRALVLVVGFLCILPSFSYLSRENAQSGEYYALILFSLVGQCVLVGAINLIMVFIGLEISSIATYVLAGFLRTDRRNNESSLKYFLLGSFATAFLLYGIAWIYGLTGSTNLNVIRQVLERSSPHTGLLPGIAAALIFVGFAFKVSVAPFQVWAPDVYQGASAPIA
ncbi:MAG: NADH-quinone oxidoreductase subunit N, partial [Bryobacteraceae bacterium]